MWNAIGLVTTGLALVAFIVAVAASIARSAIRRQNELIGSVPEKDRAGLVRDALEAFHIDTRQINSEQKLFLLLKEQMGMRERNRTRMLAFSLAALAVLSTLAAYAISVGSASRDARKEIGEHTMPGASGLINPPAPSSLQSGTNESDDSADSNCADGTNVASCNRVTTGPGARVNIEGTVNLEVSPPKKRSGATAASVPEKAE